MPPASSNQLVIPPKVTPSVSFGPNIRQYIQEDLPDTHPDVFREDIRRLDKLRSDAFDGIENRSSSKVDSLQMYAVHLAYIMKKLPPSLPPSLPFSPPFLPSSFSISTPAPPAFPNFQWELVNVLWDLGASWSARGGEEERRSPEGIGRAKKALETAAGAFHTVRLVHLPTLRSQIGQAKASELPADLKDPWLESVEKLLLAQAQECFWQAGVTGGNLKNPTVAKLSLSVAELYDEVYDIITSAAPPIRDSFPPNWISHIETKRYHFHGATQFRQSAADGEAGKYGEEIARLRLAASYVKKGMENARRGVSVAVTNDIKSLNTVIMDCLARAEQDNDLIYHQDIPASSVLAAIIPRTVVSPAGVPGISDPRTFLRNDVIFDNIIPWAVTRAAHVYEERKKDWLQEEMYSREEELEQTAAKILQSLNLPAALDALERPVGLPPSLLGKAEEVRDAGGLARIYALFLDVSKLAGTTSKLLEEAFETLDIEASEDESTRTTLPNSSLLPSNEANQALTEQATRYSGLMEQAKASDKQVSEKWEEWEEKVERLTMSESELEASVPSSTYPPSHSFMSPSASLAHSRDLRAMLESLDDLRDARRRLLGRSKYAAAHDDIKPLILREAETIGMEDLQPEVFEPLLQAELEKYETYKEKMDIEAERLSALLDSIKEQNILFMESRHNDPAVKAREAALQELDLAYHHYQEVLSNLTEGLNFYNGMARYLTDLRDKCRAWVRERRAERAEADRSSLSHKIEAMTTSSVLPMSATTGDGLLQSTHPSRVNPKAPTMSQHAYGLPPPDSLEWEPAVPLAPPVRQLRPPAAALPPPGSAIWEELQPLPPPPNRVTTPSNPDSKPRKPRRNM